MTLLHRSKRCQMGSIETVRQQRIELIKLALKEREIILAYVPDG